jgi:hypothetical protein
MDVKPVTVDFEVLNKFKDLDKSYLQKEIDAEKQQGNSAPTRQPKKEPPLGSNGTGSYGTSNNENNPSWDNGAAGNSVNDAKGAGSAVHGIPLQTMCTASATKIAWRISRWTRSRSASRLWRST